MGDRGLLSIDIEHNLSYQQFVEKYVQNKKPVVIKGAVSNWAAIEKWDIPYLKETVGHNSIELSQHHRNDKKWCLNEFLGTLEVENNEAGVRRRYLTNANIAKFFPALKGDLFPYCEYALPDWSSSSLLPKDLFFENYQVELLLGGRGSGFPLHYDRGHINAYIAQITGRKRIIIISPSDSEYLYPIPNNPNVSSINDIWNPDYKSYPLLHQVKSCQVDLEPGDLAYIPANWWHSTYNLDVSVGATFNTVNSSNWWRFIDSYCFTRRSTAKAKVKGWLMFPYLAAYGAGQTIFEKLFGSQTGSDSAGKIWRKVVSS